MIFIRYYCQINANVQEKGRNARKDAMLADGGDMLRDGYIT